MPQDWITPPNRPPLTGSERFRGIDATVTDFWAFAMPDLRTNNVRGYLAEFLVARAVGATTPRVEWDAYDVLTPEGIRVEVKSAAYLQNWAQRSLSRISFSGLKGRTWTPEDGESVEATYNADVYVFAVQTAVTHDAYDPLDVEHWTFYVLDRATVAEAGHASLSLGTIRRLGAREADFDGLREAVRAAGEAPAEPASRVVRIASWNCAGGFREKVARALDLDADVYVIQEAEPLERYAAQLPAGSETYYEKRPEYPKGVLVFTRPGFTLRPHAGVEPAPGYAHVILLTVSPPDGPEFDLWAVWTLASSPKEVSYIGQAHAAIDALAPTLRPGTVMIGDFNSNAIWDGKRKRNHTTLVDRLSLLGLSSAYHHWTCEPQGQESQPTFYLHRNPTKAFHIDHCFTDLAVAGVEIGSFADWSGLKAAGGMSDHVPLVVSLRLDA